MFLFFYERYVYWERIETPSGQMELPEPFSERTFLVPHNIHSAFRFIDETVPQQARVPFIME
jgi:hypothetical protein